MKFWSADLVVLYIQSLGKDITQTKSIFFILLSYFNMPFFIVFLQITWDELHYYKSFHMIKKFQAQKSPQLFTQ